MVEGFLCLGSVVIMTSDGRIDVELNMHLANAFKAYGASCAAAFKNKNLTITTMFTIRHSLQHGKGGPRV